MGARSAGGFAFSVDRCSRNSSSSFKRSRRSTRLPPQAWLNEDLWLEVMKFMCPGTLMRLALVNHAFHRLVMEKSVWKTACHRDLKVPYDATPRFSWRHLYASAFDGSHSYSLHDSEQHLDRRRVGIFCIQSGDALVTGDLSRLASFVANNKINKDAELCSYISNVQTGCWIADLHLVKCNFCTSEDCEGTMQVLDARHWELFLHKEYRMGAWFYEEMEEHNVPPPCNAASIGIFDAQCLKSQSTEELLKLGSWAFPVETCYPATAAKLFAVAASTSLEENEGLMVKVFTMKAGKKGAIVAIRVTQSITPGNPGNSC